ncbi:MAG: hypothetical protein NW224_11990 [Leptolyngbyaceae cyanobacterium bins.302]|nr:hypothetical protein [Leptolyngbyaceae cyanobacterium bins.302]
MSRISVSPCAHKASPRSSSLRCGRSCDLATLRTTTAIKPPTPTLWGLPRCGLLVGSDASHPHSLHNSHTSSLGSGARVENCPPAHSPRQTNSPAVVLRTYRPYPTASVPPAVGGCYTTHSQGQYRARPPSCLAVCVVSPLFALAPLRSASPAVGRFVSLVLQSGRAQSLLFGGFVPQWYRFRSSSRTTA